MKKLIFFGTLVACSVVSGSALAGHAFSPEYGGKIDGNQNRYIGFDVKGQGDDRKVTNIAMINVRFRCEDPNDDFAASGELPGRFNVKSDGSFGGTKTFVNRRRGKGTKYTLRGTLDGNEAEGTLKVSVGANCRSGLLEWKARKPAPEPPPARA